MLSVGCLDRMSSINCFGGKLELAVITIVYGRTEASSVELMVNGVDAKPYDGILIVLFCLKSNSKSLDELIADSLTNGS